MTEQSKNKLRWARGFLITHGLRAFAGESSVENGLAMMYFTNDLNNFIQFVARETGEVPEYVSLVNNEYRKPVVCRVSERSEPEQRWRIKSAGAKKCIHSEGG